MNTKYTIRAMRTPLVRVYAPPAPVCVHRRKTLRVTYRHIGGSMRGVVMANPFYTKGI